MSARTLGQATRTDSRSRRRSSYSAEAAQNRSGTVQNRPNESNWRSTIARNSGVPAAGGAPSAGASWPRSKRSRTRNAIPPHSPRPGFPIPM